MAQSNGVYILIFGQYVPNYQGFQVVFPY